MDFDDAKIILNFVMARLREERERQGVSFKRLGERSGIHRTTIADLEKLEQTPSLTICLRLAAALDLRLGDLLNEAEAAGGTK